MDRGSRRAAVCLTGNAVLAWDKRPNGRAARVQRRCERSCRMDRVADRASDLWRGHAGGSCCVRKTQVFPGLSLAYPNRGFGLDAGSEDGFCAW
jgi:hypothetical protein